MQTEANLVLFSFVTECKEVPVTKKAGIIAQLLLCYCFALTLMILVGGFRGPKEMTIEITTFKRIQLNIIIQ